MKRNTIKWRIFKYNLIMIVMLILVVTVTFNIVVRLYLERDIISQLDQITSRTVNTALHQRPAQFPEARKSNAASPGGGNISKNPSPGNGIMGKDSPSPAKSGGNGSRETAIPGEEITGARGETNSVTDSDTDKVFRYYFMLNRSLNEPLSIINADYILLDRDENLILPPVNSENDTSDLSEQIVKEIKNSSPDFSNQAYLKLNISGANYIGVVRALTQESRSDLGWIIIYTSLQKVNQLQFYINGILFIILFFLSIIAMLLSSSLSGKLSRPFHLLNQHLNAIAERNFGMKIQIPVYDELQETVNNINIMSEKLGVYDKAQKRFLQNVSHEFRTPLMSIQSYAEGIKYGVVDKDPAVDVILDETKRMTSLLEELLYLSRLEAIEENYHFETIKINSIISCIADRMRGIALQKNVTISVSEPDEEIIFKGDEEKLSRAITNIVSNCIRYAESKVTIEFSAEDGHQLLIQISDDGPGCETDDLPYIFERFYKGRKGNFGLGLAISKQVIERHNGTITAQNHPSRGAIFVIELEE
ncbi:MAG: two-component sensor histidine kinase [Bacillota bacterium]|nr:two-component sensor histidine kinase [Bacillota bacterium]